MFQFIAKAASDAADSSENPLVTCSGLDCSLCKLMEMLVNTMSWLLWVSFAVAVLFSVVGGFIYIGARGQENWMLQAKKTILWAVGGFAIVLLANLTIRTTLKVIGATDKSIIDKFECTTSDSAAKIKVPEKSAGELVKAAKNGGALTGRLGKKNASEELLKIIDGIDPADMLVIEGEIQSAKKTLAAVGKTPDKQPEILYSDQSAIKQMIQKNKSKTSLAIGEARAEEKETPEESSEAQKQVEGRINDLAAEIFQNIIRIMKKNQDLFLTITERPETANLTAEKIIGAVHKINQCFESGGTWYRFSETCKAEQESCSAQKCAPTDNFYPVTDCKCPKNKCLTAGRCVSNVGNNRTSEDDDNESDDTDSGDNTDSSSTNNRCINGKTRSGKKCINENQNRDAASLNNANLNLNDNVCFLEPGPPKLQKNLKCLAKYPSPAPLPTPEAAPISF